MSTQVKPPAAEFTGLGQLCRLVLRRDRVTLPAWTAGFAAFALYLVVALPTAYGLDEDLKATAGLFADPMGRLLVGPVHGFDDPTLAIIIANGYGLYFLLLAALMSILSVTRHTRAEEQSERAELIRANVVGRHATLTAALLVTALANVLAGTASTLVLIFAGYAPSGSVLFGVGIVLTGLAFAGVSAITTQLSEYSRAASGLAGIVLGAAFVIRGGGDMAAIGGTALSWFAPLAWAQQTAPFALDRWWPLALTVAFAVVTSAIGYWLSTRRDFGASFFSVRPGSGRAPARWGTPIGWAWRQQRALIWAWGLSLAVFGLAFGAFAESLRQAELPEIFSELFTVDDMILGYLAFMTLFSAYLVAAFAVMAVHGYRTEETSTRLEPILATAVSRVHWLSAQVVVTAGAATAILVIMCGATGLGAALGTGRWGNVVDLSLAALNLVPPVLVVLAFAVLLFGVAPRLLSVAWALIGYAFFFGTFGGLLDAPQVWLDVSPFTHPAEMPIESFTWVPVAVLTGIAVVGVLAGLTGFRRRDVSGG